jgi:N-acetyl-anhydromuramyl-L-alanine amidase AmpD
MAYSTLTEEGKKFIRKVCEGNGNDLIQGKHSYPLPYTSPPVNQIWTCKILMPNSAKLISTNQELGEAIIIWFNQYAEDFQLDANVIAAQAYAESGYMVWNFPGGDSTASGINQFVMLTTFWVIVENMGNAVIPGSKTTMTPMEIATITNGLKNPKSRDSYNVKSSLPQDAFYNRPLLHQNIIDNPAIMIKAQCYYMKFFANNSDSLTSTSLFCYSRGTYMSKTYSTSIQKCDAGHTKDTNYKNEGLNYVLKIFGILGDKANALEGKGLGKGYKPRGIYFGYDAEHFPTVNNIPHSKNLRLLETWNPYMANVDESGQYNLQNDITETNADIVVQELSKYPQYKFIYYPEQYYFRKQTPKVQLVLHHTASGGASAAGDILWWENEVKRSGDKVAVSFIVTKDGMILQLFSTYYWAYHLGTDQASFKEYGTTGINNEQLNSQSIAIEIDNWGGLINIGGNWHPAASPTSAAIPIQDVIEYKAPDYPHGYHGFAAFERYTDAQIGSLRVLINAISKGNQKIADALKYSGDDMWGTYDNGTGKWLANRRAFAETPGIWTHVSYRPDKSDCQPQPSLVNLLKTLV